MHMTWDISVGNLLTVLVAVVSAVFAAGRFAQVLTIIGRDLGDLKRAFVSHQADDNDHFERVYTQLFELARAAQKKGS